MIISRNDSHALLLPTKHVGVDLRQLAQWLMLELCC
jgi:hypothetical protein